MVYLNECVKKPKKYNPEWEITSSVKWTIKMKEKRREKVNMNKNVIRMCGLVLSGILCFSGGIHGKAVEISKEDSGNEVLMAEPYLVTTGSAISIYNNSYQIQASEEEKTNIIVPVVTTNAGLVAYDIDFFGDVVTKGSVSVTIYKDAECEKVLNKKKTYQIDTQTKEPISGSVYLEQGQNCYVQISVSNELMTEDKRYRFCLRLQEYSSGNCTLQNKETVYSYQNGKGNSAYYKITVKETGILTINTYFDEFSYGTPMITLCNNKKKAISANCGIQVMNAAKVKKKKETPEGRNIFAVSKGTYYLKLSDIKGTYKIQSVFSKITENSGKTKAKAKKLTLGGKVVQGVILSSDKKTVYDWYKFTLEESHRIRIGFQGSTSGKEKIQLEVIPPSSAKFTNKAVLGFSGLEENGSGKSGTQWPVGTYYLRIKKTTAKGTGTYRLRVKTY